MSLATARKTDHYTWSDYQCWPDDQRWEIIGGDAFDMSPAPLTRHQAIVGELHLQIATFLKSHKCKAFVSPTDVKLSEEDVVQPDLLVVCDQTQVKRTHIEGPPALVVEVVSEATLVHDRVHKFRLYARAGIPEYWIVTPYPHLIEVYELRGEHYVLSGGYSENEAVLSRSFHELALDMRRIFDFPLEDGEKVKMVREAHPSYGAGSPAANAAAK